MPDRRYRRGCSRTARPTARWGVLVLISRDSIGNDLPCRMADFVSIFWTSAKHAVFDDIEFDDDLIAKMMANIAVERDDARLDLGG